MRSSEPSSLGVFAWPRRQASGNGFWLTIRVPRARKAIFNWQRRFWIVNKPDNARKVLGKGLNALLPTRPPVAAQTQTDPAPEITHTVGIDQIDANPLQPRRTFQSERLARAARTESDNSITEPLG